MVSVMSNFRWKASKVKFLKNVDSNFRPFYIFPWFYAKNLPHSIFDFVHVTQNLYMFQPINAKNVCNEYGILKIHKIAGFCHFRLKKQYEKITLKFVCLLNFNGFSLWI